MKSSRKREKNRVASCAENDVTIQTAEGRGNSNEADDYHEELSPHSELANRIFVGNISYRVSYNAIEDQSIISHFMMYCLSWAFSLYIYFTGVAQVVRQMWRANFKIIVITHDMREHNAYTHAHMHRHVHAHTCTYTHTYVHMHAHTHTHTHTHALEL